MNHFKQTAGAVLFAVLVLLMFFSGTIYNYRLPVVTAALPKNGTLSKSETVTGITAWSDTYELYAPLNGKVADLHVHEGDIVSQGQPLFSVTYDTEELLHKIAENEISERRLALDLENIKLQTQKLNQRIADLQAEVYKADEVSQYELEKLAGDIARAEENYAGLAELFAAGVTPRQEVEKAASDLSVLRDQQADMVKKLKEQAEKNAEAVTAQETSRQQQITDYQYELNLLRQDEKGKALERESLALQRESYEKSLAAFAQYAVIYAPEEGVLLNFDIKQGQFINENQWLGALGLGDRFQIECEVRLSNNFIAVGDSAIISNTAHYFDATVTKIVQAEQGKQVTVSFNAKEVTAGETFDIAFKKDSAVSYTLVPNAAIHMDSEGYFLYQIKRRDGLLGKEFYPVKQRVYIGDSDAEYTVITAGVTFFEPVVLLSDKYFEENHTIRLSNEGDFFES